MPRKTPTAPPSGESGRYRDGGRSLDFSSIWCDVELLASDLEFVKRATHWDGPVALY